MSAIDDAARVVNELVADVIAMPQDMTNEIADIIKRELEKAAPAYSPEVENTSSRATGWNECLRKIGLSDGRD